MFRKKLPRFLLFFFTLAVSILYSAYLWYLDHTIDFMYWITHTPQSVVLEILMKPVEMIALLLLLLLTLLLGAPLASSSVDTPSLMMSITSIFVWFIYLVILACGVFIKNRAIFVFLYVVLVFLILVNVILSMLLQGIH